MFFPRQNLPLGGQILFANFFMAVSVGVIFALARGLRNKFSDPAGFGWRNYSRVALSLCTILSILAACKGLSSNGFMNIILGGLAGDLVYVLVVVVGGIPFLSEMGYGENDILALALREAVKGLAIMIPALLLFTLIPPFSWFFEWLANIYYWLVFALWDAIAGWGYRNRMGFRG